MSAGGAARAPWFYRQRYAVFGMTYGLSFGLGFPLVQLAGISPRPFFALLPAPAFWAAFGFALIAFGLALRVWGSSYLSGSVMIAHDPQARDFYVAGPYRYTRNPLYLGNILQAAGLGLATPWPISIVLVVAIAALDLALIGVEEPFLAAERGEAYRAYLAAVPRLIPLPGRVAAAPPPERSPKPSLIEGLKAELIVGLLPVIAYVLLIAGARSR